MENQEEQVIWKLPKSLLLEIEEYFEEQDNEFAIASNYKCVKKGEDYYCEKWVDGAKITRGPYMNCPSGCD